MSSSEWTVGRQSWVWVWLRLRTEEVSCSTRKTYWINKEGVRHFKFPSYPVLSPSQPAVRKWVRHWHGVQGCGLWKTAPRVAERGANPPWATVYVPVMKRIGETAPHNTSLGRFYRTWSHVVPTTAPSTLSPNTATLPVPTMHLERKKNSKLWSQDQ